MESYYLGFPPGPSPIDPAKSETSSFLDLGEIECNLMYDDLLQRAAQTQTWFTTGGYSSIIGEPLTALASQLQVVIELCSDDIDPTAIQNALMVQACEEYIDATVNILTDPPPLTQEALEAWFLRLIAAEALKQMVGVNCGQEIEDVIGEGIDRYIDMLIVRFQTPGYLDDHPWSVVWEEMNKAAIHLRGAATQWGIQAAFDRMNQDLLPTQYLEFRRSAFRSCQGEFNDQSYLADLLSGGHLRNHPIEPEEGLPWWAQITVDELIDDAQYCGSPLEIEVYDAVVELIESAELGPGDEPGESEGQIEIVAPYDGFIDLRGPIRTLFCYSPSGSSFSQDKLVLRANELVLESFDPSEAGDFLASTYDISVAQVLQSLGLPEDAAQAFQLTLTREGPACDAQYGEGNFELFTIDVTTGDGICDDPAILAKDGKLYAPCELLVTLDYPDRIDDEVFYDLTVHVETPGAEPVEGAELQISLTSNFGKLGESTGITDAAGNFVTSALIDSNDNDMTISASASLGAASGQGSTYTLRNNEILIRSRESSWNVGVSFTYIPTTQAVIAYRDGDGEIHLSGFDPIERSGEAQGSGSALGMSSSGQVSIDLESTITQSGNVFSSCFHTATITGTASFQNPSPEVESYASQAEGGSDLKVSFSVWGDPASYNLTFNQGDQSRVSLHGPDDFEVCFEGSGPCPPPDPDDKQARQLGIASSLAAAGGELLPGHYTFNSHIRSRVLFHLDPDYPNSGSETLQENATVNFSVSQ